MVQLRYFGDDRDFFKYDLITHIFGTTELSNYIFIPMLTHHRDSNEGNKAPKPCPTRSEELFRFITLCPNKSLEHWEEWLTNHVDTYETIEPIDRTFFSDENREMYWEKFKSLIKSNRALVFVDPDTGLETGTPSYLRKSGRDKYLLNKELESLIDNLSESSCLMIYQHLQRNKNRHDLDVQKKLDQIQSVDNSIYIGAYREDDLVFIFISKHVNVYKNVLDALTGYHDKARHKYGEIYKRLSTSRKPVIERQLITQKSTNNKLEYWNQVFERKQLKKLSPQAENSLQSKPAYWNLLLVSQLLVDGLEVVENSIELDSTDDIPLPLLRPPGKSQRDLFEDKRVDMLYDISDIEKCMEKLIYEGLPEMIKATQTPEKVADWLSHVTEQYRSLGNILQECKLICRHDASEVPEMFPMFTESVNLQYNEVRLWKKNMKELVEQSKDGIDSPDVVFNLIQKFIDHDYIHSGSLRSGEESDLSMSDIREQLDYEDLRRTLIPIILFRLVDSEIATAKVISTFTLLDSPVADEIKNNLEVRTDIIKHFISNFSNGELFDLIEQNARICPVLTIHYLSSSSSEKNKKILNQWLLNNGLEPIHPFTKYLSVVFLALIVIPIIMIFIWPSVITIILSLFGVALALILATSERDSFHSAADKAMKNIDKFKEPAIILFPDSRKL